MEQLMQALAEAKPPKYLYHFTDTRNLDSIRQNGLLSLRELRERQIPVAAYGGDQASRDIDAYHGLDRFVHLCLTNSHPMEFRARERGSIQQSFFVAVDPAVLTMEGTMFCPVVSTTNGEPIRPIAQVDEFVDFEVAFSKTDWSDPEIKARLQAVRKFEILVPDHIEPSLLRNL